MSLSVEKRVRTSYDEKAARLHATTYILTSDFDFLILIDVVVSLKMSARLDKDFLYRADFRFTNRRESGVKVHDSRRQISSINHGVVCCRRSNSGGRREENCNWTERL